MKRLIDKLRRILRRLHQRLSRKPLMYAVCAKGSRGRCRMVYIGAGASYIHVGELATRTGCYNCGLYGRGCWGPRLEEI